MDVWCRKLRNSLSCSTVTLPVASRTSSLPAVVGHASAATDRMYSVDAADSTAGKYSRPIGPS